MAFSFCIIPKVKGAEECFSALGCGGSAKTPIAHGLRPFDFFASDHFIQTINVGVPLRWSGQLILCLVYSIKVIEEIRQRFISVAVPIKVSVMTSVFTQTVSEP